jgi:cysteinyl-tRNA synthetase
LQPVTASTAPAQTSSPEIKPREQFIELSNDLNVARVLETIEAELTSYEQDSDRTQLTGFIGTTDDLLGLNLSTSLQSNLTDAQLQLIAQREAARVVGEWAQSDKLREELRNQGVGLRDTVEGTIWFQL